MPPRCACAFCTSPARLELPAVVLCGHEDSGIAFWMWMTRANPSYKFLVLDAAGKWRPYQQITAAVNFALKEHFSHELASSSSSLSSFAGAVVVFVKLPGGDMQKLETHRVLFGTATAAPPSSSECRDGPRCEKAKGAMAVATPPVALPFVAPPPVAPPFVAPPPVAPPPVAPPPVAPLHKKQRRAATSRGVHTPPRPPPSPPTREDGEAFSPMSEDGTADAIGRSYAPSELGGDEAEVAAVLELRPRWDQETVNELFRWGASPPLFRVTRTVVRRHFTSAVCVFVQPCGRLVDGIEQPLGVLKMRYPAQTSHLSV